MDLRRRLVAAVAVLAVSGAACGEVGEPDLGVLPATSTTSTTIGEALPDDPSIESEPEPAAAPYVTQLTPSRPADFRPQVLVADQSGVRLLHGPVLLPAVPAARVLDDPTGGLVIETVEAEVRRVVWYPAGGQPPEVVAQGSARLMDVGFVDGGVHVVLADGAELRLVRLGEPEERVLTTLPPDTTVTSVSGAAGLYAVVVRDDACGALWITDGTGTRLDVGRVPEPTCETPGRGTYGMAAFSPDGDTFAYTERTFRSDNAVASTQLVVRDLQGTELHRSTVGGEGQRLVSLSLDGQRVALLRESPAGPEVVQLDLRQPSEAVTTPVPGATWATFTRVPSMLPGT